VIVVEHRGGRKKRRREIEREAMTQIGVEHSGGRKKRN
jgi:hypothetical protein